MTNRVESCPKCLAKANKQEWLLSGCVGATWGGRRRIQNRKWEEIHTETSGRKHECCEEPKRKEVFNDVKLEAREKKSEVMEESGAYGRKLHLCDVTRLFVINAVIRRVKRLLLQWQSPWKLKKIDYRHELNNGSNIIILFLDVRFFMFRFLCALKFIYLNGMNSVYFSTSTQYSNTTYGGIFSFATDLKHLFITLI